MEQDTARNALYNSMLTVPHRDYDQAVTPLKVALNSDPLFASRALVYLAMNSTIRDIQDSAIITLLQSEPLLDFRESGRCLLLGSDVYKTDPDGLKGTPYFRFFRVMRYILESETKIPRLFKSIMNDFLQYVEQDEGRLTNMLLYNRKDVKWAYTMAHRKAPPLVVDVVFNNNPPEGSVFHLIKEVASCRDASRQAELLLNSKVPYRIAQTIIKEYTIETGIALISLMTPTEAMNSAQWVTNKGLLEIPEVRKAMEDKIKQSTKSVASARHRRSAQTTDVGLKGAIDEAVQKATDAGARIKGNILIAVDRSGSMREAIEVAKECGMRVAPHCDGEIMVVVFNDVATEIEVKNPTSVLAWEEAFRPVKPMGQTSMGSAVRLAHRKGFEPTAGILVVSDGQENAFPYMGTYMKDNGLTHYRVVSLLVGQHRYPQLDSVLTQAGVNVEKINWQGDYYAFDQIVTFFSGEPVQSLAEKIMETPMPRRVK